MFPPPSPPWSETVVVTAGRDEEAIVDWVALATALDAAAVAILWRRHPGEHPLRQTGCN